MIATPVAVCTSTLPQGVSSGMHVWYHQLNHLQVMLTSSPPITWWLSVLCPTVRHVPFRVGQLQNFDARREDMCILIPDVKTCGRPRLQAHA